MKSILIVLIVFIVALIIFSLFDFDIIPNDDKDDKTTTTQTETDDSNTDSSSTDNQLSEEFNNNGTANADSEADGDESVPADATLAIPEKRWFADTSPWNTRIDGMSVDARSARMISLANQRVGILEQPGNLPPVIQYRTNTEGLYINTVAWTPIIVSGGKKTTITCRQKECGDGKTRMTLNVPETDPDPRYDGRYAIIQGNTVYDLWRARREEDGSISYQFMRKWDLNGQGFSKPEKVAATGSGLPLVAGVIRPNELQAGRIEHALAIAVPGPAQRSFVQPASVTNGNGQLDSLPEGARIRLKDGVRLPEFDSNNRRITYTKQQRRLADAIIVALRHYGAIVVERAEVPTLYAQYDGTNSLIQGNEVSGLQLDDFEVVTLPKILKDPPLEEEDLQE